MQGIFPMGSPDGDHVDWYSPDPRGILPLETFHVPKNLARLVRQGRFVVRCDAAFEQVMRQCAIPRGQHDQAWISEPLINAYVGLHEAGQAHSIEAWLGDRLVGGLYGVHIGGAFFGESMFSRPAEGGTNASKVCLVHLVRWLRRRGSLLLDTQFTNEHLSQFGCIEIPRHDYMRRLHAAIAQPVTWGRFDSEVE